MSSLRLPIALILTALFAAGCVISTSSHTKRSGNYVSDTTLSQIEEGDGRDFVEAVLGEPTEQIFLGGGGELWKWSYTETRTSNGSIILLLGANQTNERRSQVYVRFDEDGYVERVWRDGP